MIEPHTRLSVVRQCELVAVSRASVYYRGRACPHDELELMRRMDAQYLRTPFYGSRSLTTYLRRLGYHPINRIRVRRLMRVMGLRSIAPTPNTSQPHPAHKVYPYLLRDLDIKRANQVGAADITYVPMARGFMYLAAIIDWYRRRVLAWRVSNSLDSHFCSEALQAAIDRYGVQRDLQHRSGPVHQRGVYRLSQKPWHPHQHGRQGLLPGQHLRRAVMAQRAIRMPVHPGIRERQGLTTGIEAILRLV